MDFKIDMPAGALFDLVTRFAILISALLSTWVLASARRRFPIHYAILWAVGTLLLPLSVLPIYLVVILFWRRPVYSPRRRFGLPLAYGSILVLSLSLYFYFDYRSVDARLARATDAKLVSDTTTAINEYRSALALEDSPHTRKLLAIELVQAGYLSEAVSEFRLSQQGGEPDDSIHYQLGLVLEKLDQNGQAAIEFEQFLLSETCLRPDSRCDSARERLERFGS